MIHKRTKIYEGKSKAIYEGPDPHSLIQHFKDDATAFDNQKRDIVEGRGVLNHRISEYIFTHLNQIGVATHFIKSLNMREQLIHKLEMIPIEVIVRNIAAGSIVKRLGLKEGEALPHSIIELCYKSDRLGDPLVSEEHIAAFGWASPQEIDEMMAIASRVNDYLSGLFTSIGIILVDFKLEFGRQVKDDQQKILLGDEISPDSCRLWDIKSKDKMDKDRFRHDMGGIIEAYQEVARRLGLFVEPLSQEKSPKKAQKKDQAKSKVSYLPRINQSEKKHPKKTKADKADKDEPR